MAPSMHIQYKKLLKIAKKVVILKKPSNNSLPPRLCPSSDILMMILRRWLFRRLSPCSMHSWLLVEFFMLLTLFETFDVFMYQIHIFHIFLCHISKCWVFHVWTKYGYTCLKEPCNKHLLKSMHVVSRQKLTSRIQAHNLFPLWPFIEIKHQHLIPFQHDFPWPIMRQFLVKGAHYQ